MKIIKNKKVYFFSKEDIATLAELYHDFIKEGESISSFGYFIKDIFTNDPQDRLYDFDDFDTLTIKIEE